MESQAPPKTKNKKKVKDSRIKKKEPFTSKRTKKLLQERYETRARKKSKIEEVPLAEKPVFIWSFFHKLPFDLLDMILSYCHSYTVLSLAKTSKWLCDTLTDPKAEFIWKRARLMTPSDREGMPGPPPDPLPHIPEPAHAEAIWGGGLCQICQARVTAPPRWLHDRIWICLNTSTCNNWNKLKSLFEDAMKPDPYFLLLTPWLPEYTGPDAQPLHLKSTCVLGTARLQSVSSDVEKMQQLYEEWKILEKRKPRINESIKEYRNWRSLYDLTSRGTMKYNEAKWKSSAQRRGWSLADAQNSSTLRELLQTNKRLNSFINSPEWHYYLPKITQEVEVIKRQRESAEIERQRQHRHKVVIQYLNNLKSRSGSSKSPPSNFPIHLPTPGEFRKLPVIRSFETNLEIKKLDKKLETDDLKLAIKGDLEKWLARMRNVFGAQLGFKKKDITGLAPDALHPTERLTALFECQKCRRNGRMYDQSGGCMTFHETLSHICPKYVVKNQKDREWDRAKFVVDKVAVEVVKEVVRVGQWDEGKLKRKEVEETGSRFKCEQCGLNMKFENLIGHAKRHIQPTSSSKVPLAKQDSSATKDLQEPSSSSQPCHTVEPTEPTGPVPPFRLSLLTSLEYHILKQSTPDPYPGLEALMMDTPKFDKLRQKPIFSCRHCPKEARRKGGYTINGLCSHLGTRHQVVVLREEDFYCVIAELPKKEGITIESTKEQQDETPDLLTEIAEEYEM